MSRDYPRVTYMRCRKCGCEMRPRCHPPYNMDTCAQCSYLEALGVVTIEDYKKWLRGEWKCQS